LDETPNHFDTTDATKAGNGVVNRAIIREVIVT